MTYQDQLTQPEWAAKREEIFTRDNCKCTDCGKQRSEFRGLAKFTDLIDGRDVYNAEELKSQGYPLVIEEKSQTDGYLFFFKDNWAEEATFIGDKKRAFIANDLRFCRKFEKPNSKARPALFFFYQDTMDSQGRVDLNVHHKYYISGRKAWEYDNDALALLCSECHKKTHQEQTIYVYSSSKVKDGVREIDYATKVCFKCGGAGILPEYYYNQKGVCFGCHGEGAVGV